MRSFGARVGDLVIAFNPRTNLFVPAIIGDSGPANNLGEGSILLNMKLLGQTVPPTNKAETFRLSIEDDGSDYSWFTFVSTRKALHG